MSVTYPRGFRAAATVALEPRELLPGSTGVIGELVHMDELLEALPPLAGALTPEGGGGFARATTTTVAPDDPRRIPGCDLSYDRVRIHGEHTT